MQPEEDFEDWPQAQDPSTFSHYPSQPRTPEESQSLKIKLNMAPVTRGATRQRTASVASGSEYHASNASMDAEEPMINVEPAPAPIQVFTTTSRGRKIARKSYKESGSEDDPLVADFPLSPSKMDVEPDYNDHGEDEDEENQPRYRTRHSTRLAPKMNGTIYSDDEGQPTTSRYETRSRSKNVNVVPEINGHSSSRRITRRSGSRAQASNTRSTRSRTATRRTRQNGLARDDDDGYVQPSSPSSADGDGSFDEAAHTSSEVDADADADAEGDIDAEVEVEPEPEQDGRPYALRQRTKINYAIPPPLEEMAIPSKPRPGGGRHHGRNTGLGRSKAPGWSATGAELSRWMGGAGDDSDSDHPGRNPKKPFAAGNSMGGVFAGGAGGGLYPSDLAAAAGTPSNLGKIGDASLADADPLGVNQNVTFDEVGGLDDHINSLKEMTLLPLLYPEVFQRFNLTPPRGVLFHGPPGTGKTLLARALAASCRSDGKRISFFMRKGADCLSKWVGEAERQLRLLFEEARNQQPSIIFFDEIDGLAPVRSSKQDQIHASIVSTLLALMDGMDGRGQVIIIGATNRPDAIDPALRRPGRFDREFYFPLPSLDARVRILRIMTQKWADWDSDKGEEHVKGLASLTKGYGGADLRALCTEAALNAVQRRYPQIYKTSERLLLKPETIGVELRDFMIAIKRLIPSSARSVSSAAAPLPTQLAPLLQDSLDRAKEVVDKALPLGKKRTALEEAEWEDESHENALERELLLQSMESLRVYRPRVVLHGVVGMGQSYVAAALLHHLEGYHIQSLDLGSLMSDSTRTPEAAIVQLFVEAKRHQPSVVYIPSLVGWCAAVSETSRTTVRAMLETLAPTDPVLLLAVVDGPFKTLPRDVRAWFGQARDNRVELNGHTTSQRDAFFDSLLTDVSRPPNHFPDGVKRKKRILEELPIAPPVEPRQPTAAELALQEESDQRVVTLLRFRLGPILQELKRKFKRFTKRAVEEYNYDFQVAVTNTDPNANVVKEVEIVTTSVEVRTETNGAMEVTEQQHTEQQVVEAQAEVVVNGIHEPVPQQPPEPRLFDIDLERMHFDLYRNRYLTPDDFLTDIRRIVHNAEVRVHEDPDRLFRAQAMLTAAEVSINDFDLQFRAECARMASRERKRREEYKKSKEKEEKAAAEVNPNGLSPVYAPGTRRSARHNGQQPEISITDPTVLERRLKRPRSTSAVATPSEDEAGERGQKRSRLASEVDEPMPGPSSQECQPGVRFIDNSEPMQISPFLSQPQPNGVDEVILADEGPRKSGGFDPSLLNPMPSPALQAGPASPITTIDYSAFVSHDGPSPAEPPMAQTELRSEPPYPGQLDTETHEPATDLAGVEFQSHSTVGPSSTIAMEIERSPTPLPEFILNEDRLSELRQVLRDRTDTLNIEQLEQLRATCLGCVWRHRTEWDRTELMYELVGVVERFVREVSLDDMDSPSSPGL
ncbi:uncharacterized protein FIBRA_07150 [Fibroporia radiculosa]|uniref:AAA+ ATPase domain-containing protein n=1 Tax=Fibroporia radiculosa TaxID=599839 RepID=J4GDL7_9APHY|nr:uncharacterized protein FIBRA_07150 [Fibroporia radiculosa]CCM04953.1 predicted protein [Fibroporia radiculosa]